MTSHHDHSHCHHHAAPNHFGRAFAIAIVLNIGFVFIEVAYGLISHSMALLADAGHNMFDVIGLVLSWWATFLVRQKPDERFTYGLRSSTILAALANAVLLLVASGGIAWEAIHRFFVPSPVEAMTVSIVAGAGILVNGFSAWLFHKGSKSDLNARSAFIHMAADAMVSLGVVLGGIIIAYTSWLWIDPLLSLIIVVVIVYSTWGLLRDSGYMALGAVPKQIDLKHVRAFLLSHPQITEVDDLHVWSMSTQETALTAHLIMPGGHPGDAFVNTITDGVRKQFDIRHSTFQIMLKKSATQCSLDITGEGG